MGMIPEVLCVGHLVSDYDGPFVARKTKPMGGVHERRLIQGLAAWWYSIVYQGKDLGFYVFV